MTRNPPSSLIRYYKNMTKIEQAHDFSHNIDISTDKIMHFADYQQNQKNLHKKRKQFQDFRNWACDVANKSAESCLKDFQMYYRFGKQIRKQYSNDQIFDTEIDYKTIQGVENSIQQAHPIFVPTQYNFQILNQMHLKYNKQGFDDDTRMSLRQINMIGTQQFQVRCCNRKDAKEILQDEKYVFYPQNNLSINQENLRYAMLEHFKSKIKPLKILLSWKNIKYETFDLSEKIDFLGNFILYNSPINRRKNIPNLRKQITFENLIGLAAGYYEPIDLHNHMTFLGQEQKNMEILEYENKYQEQLQIINNRVSYLKRLKIQKKNKSYRQQQTQTEKIILDDQWKEGISFVAQEILNKIQLLLLIKEKQIQSGKSIIQVYPPIHQRLQDYLFSLLMTMTQNQKSISLSNYMHLQRQQAQKDILKDIYQNMNSILEKSTLDGRNKIKLVKFYTKTKFTLCEQYNKLKEQTKKRQRLGLISNNPKKSRENIPVQKLNKSSIATSRQRKSLTSANKPSHLKSVDFSMEEKPLIGRHSAFASVSKKMGYLSRSALKFR